MRSQQIIWTQQTGWTPAGAGFDNVSLVLYFGARQTLLSGERYRELRAMFPTASILGCSTGGQIHDNEISDDGIVAAAIQFDATRLQLHCLEIGDIAQTRESGVAIGRALAADDLAGVFVLSDGLNVNGSELIAGITSTIGLAIPLVGGLAGDGADFKETLVGGDCAPQPHAIAAIGFYGSAIRLGFGSAGGWDVFGPRRRITRSTGNVLFEFDGEPALDLYERYLGPEECAGLPGSALLFPIQIHDGAHTGTSLVRTVLAIDRDTRSLIFGADVPQGWTATLMRGNLDRLAAGAASAAQLASTGLHVDKADHQFSILVSCIGRRLLMGQRTADEIEAAGAELAPGMPRLGFYSYGEISPHATSGRCELHNQTMTITSFAEVPD
jgi:hypothetical protein